MNPSISEQAVFSNALARVHPGERSAYLDGVCGGDSDLRSRVESLLAAVPLLDGFLEESSTELLAEPRAIPGGLPERGEHIGRYRLLEVIGEGGCGVVYMAEQLEPMRRRVALKVIKPGMYSRSVLARFEAERQALALMDHPNIARVLDAGATPLGRPFVVMELVRGVRITDYCDQARLDTRARLALVVQVCHAVQHAHQKGVIHRDLKPSNILVTVNDGVPVPKVIDFGIAKAIGQRLTEKTVFTHFHAFLGTPAYTSPEQAEMSSVDVDTRADIYSLGVLLYELLTGQTPFDGDTLLRSGFDEMRRILREVEPLRPSARLTTLDPAFATELSRRREVRIPELARSVRGDLDWIVMRCLEKDRARRYETADALALDLRRHLDDEAVSARPPDLMYRLGKGIRRHRVAVFSSVAVGVVLAGGVASSLWQASRAREALEALRSSAPAFVEQARALVDRGQVPAAIEKLAHAVRLQPEVTSHQLARASLLRAELRLTEAREAYEQVLKLDPVHATALANARLCAQLVAAPKAMDGTLSRESLARLQQALEAEDRPAAERMQVARLLGREGTVLRDYWLSRLRDLSMVSGPPLSARLTASGSGALLLDLSRTSVGDLSVLKGMPLEELDLTGCKAVADLIPLAGIPLKVLRLSGTQVRDLAPLAGMVRLETLDLGFTPVSDVGPLRGLPIRELNLRQVRVGSLAPLSGMPLAFLDLTAVPVSDLSPLNACPLQELNLQRTRVRDLGPLRGMPLKQLNLYGCAEVRGLDVLSELRSLETLILPVEFRSLPDVEQEAINRLRNLPALRQIGVEIMAGMSMRSVQSSEAFWDDRRIEERIAAPLRALGLRRFILTRFPEGSYALNLNGDPLRDLSVLPGDAPIAHLNLSHTQVTDLSPIRRLPLTRLDLVDTGVTNLAPLRGTPIEELFLSQTGVRDLSPLSGLPLRTLFLMGTPVTDLSPLVGSVLLRELLLPGGATNVGLLRGLPRLERLTYLWHAETARPPESTEEFWKHREVQARLFQALEAGGIQYLASDSQRGGWVIEIHDPRFWDLSLLRGIPIHELDLDRSAVRDLSPLKDSGIAILNLRETAITDLSPLHESVLGASLRELRASRTGIRDLTPLRGCPDLELLDVGGTPIWDLRPLRGLRLRRLYLTETPVLDLAPLSGMPLRTLYLDRCREVQSVAILCGLQEMEEVMLPKGAKDIGELRKLPRLERVGFRWKPGIGPECTASEFWRFWDQGGFPGGEP